MISAKVVADSLCPKGHRLTTLEVVMPRYILAEFNTHRMFSRNSASSRAIRFETMVKAIRENPFIPYAWQKDHAGMQGTEYHTDKDKIEEIKNFWLNGMEEAITYASVISDENVTKQICNRTLEAYMYHKVLVTATEWENFFKLRLPNYSIPFMIKDEETEIHGYNNFSSRKQAIEHNPHLNCYTLIDWLKCNNGQADIHMMFTAEAIYDAINESIPKQLKEGEWHIPYGDNIDWITLKDYYTPTGNYNPENPTPNKYYTNALEELARKISIVRCARVSYHIAGQEQIIDYEADLKLYDRLASSGHWSPFEHVAIVMTSQEYELSVNGRLEWTRGQYDKPLPTENSEGWCRNFRGFIQQRAMMD